MRSSRIAFGVFLGATAIIGAGCGWYGGGGGGGGSKVRVMGNIDAVLPGDTGRDIVVFVFRVSDEHDDCTEPLLPESDTSKERQTLEDGATEFNLKAPGRGRLVVAFLLDEEGNDSDGRIDPGDPVAVLNDPDCVLDDVPNKYDVEATDVRINFTIDEDAIGFPEPGRAEAGLLSEGPRD